MKRFNQPSFKYCFFAIDLIIFTGSYLFALNKILHSFLAASTISFYFCLSHFTFFIIFIFIYLFTFRYNSLYKRKIVISHLRQFVILLKSLLAASFAAGLFMAAVNVDYFANYGKDFILYFLFFSVGPLIVFRMALGREIFKFLIKNKIYKSRVLIVGADEAGKYVSESLKEDSFSDFQITGFLDDYKDVGLSIYDGYENLGKLADLEIVIDELNPDEIIIAIDHAPYERLIYIVDKCLQTGKRVCIYSDLLRIIADKMDVELYGNIPIIYLSQLSLDSVTWKDKRTLDIILASIALVALAPVFLVIAIGIKISSRGPVLFKQKRIGKAGRPFDFYKFRSMHIGTDDSKHKEYVTDFIKGNNSGKTEDIQVFKIIDDYRIFKFGKFIRKTSLDEFPQFFNVLKGDMSLVGPRPCLPYEWECYEHWHKKRLTTLPGCTGLWQALGRSSVTFEEMVILDLYYISNMRLWLDFKIVLQTFPVIFFGKGGH